MKGQAEELETTLVLILLWRIRRRGGMYVSQRGGKGKGTHEQAQTTRTQGVAETAMIHGGAVNCQTPAGFIMSFSGYLGAQA